MRYIFVLLAIFGLSNITYAAEQLHGRYGVEEKHSANSPRATVSTTQFASIAAASSTVSTAALAVKQPEMVDVIEEIKIVDDREAERQACESNNIGIGNTFVWASKNSDTSSYSSMVEDVENPEKNACFVRVEIKSDDSKISVSDIQPKYFMWGENITCGSWVDEEVMRQRILDAKKGARVGGIVASTVGGLGLGVGAMELFGNKLIGGKVQGQKDLAGYSLYRSQLLVLKDKEPARYEGYVANLRDLKAACEQEDKKAELKNACTGNEPNCCIKYEKLMNEFAR